MRHAAAERCSSPFSYLLLSPTRLMIAHVCQHRPWSECHPSYSVPAMRVRVPAMRMRVRGRVPPRNLLEVAERVAPRRVEVQVDVRTLGAVLESTHLLVRVLVLRARHAASDKATRLQSATCRATKKRGDRSVGWSSAPSR